jgi:hypothetical protein
MERTIVRKELFSVQNDYWKLTETAPGIFDVVSKIRPSLTLIGCTLKELATLDGPIFELQRHLQEAEQ